MNKLPSFRERIDVCSHDKGSKIVLALDPLFRTDLMESVKSVIVLLEKYICAIKINFHLILPLSISQMSEINELIHSYRLQSIADIKLNDIPRTNEVAIDYLLKMGFDAVIVNPFVGKGALQAAVNQAHKNSAGVIALIYMSHPGAEDGFNIHIMNRNTRMYKLFLEHAYECQVDGIVIGATQTNILKEISDQKQVPIYSPGFGPQGGNILQAAKNGTDYFIVGSAIIRSTDPVNVVKQIQQEISCV
ncbi:MAG TPA: orotidine 5'-phosphate decarboxylase / HUMPS family protein [Nitrososphaeraceae archaeon]|jgi:orotidine-5'-phosphate decarboxylase|nr:orotidine 5'-phosphate decarboxylase / HUMPS family protein [Nitrososphaeraceae archaeon]